MKNHIHTSLLDTDLYKFTMQQSVLHKHMGAIVGDHFRCRTDGVHRGDGLRLCGGRRVIDDPDLAQRRDRDRDLIEAGVIVDGVRV